jgi:hypothetical protein
MQAYIRIIHCARRIVSLDVNSYHWQRRGPRDGHGRVHTRMLNMASTPNVHRAIASERPSELHFRRCTRGRPEDPNMQCEPQTRSACTCTFWGVRRILFDSRGGCTPNLLLLRVHGEQGWCVCFAPCPDAHATRFQIPDIRSI